MNVTIKDIARETGVSIATVSKYLNGKKISSENEESIRSAIQKLGYKPNRSAQMLRAKKTKEILIMTPNISNYFWGATISGISRYFGEQNYAVITRSYRVGSSSEEETIRVMVSRKIDGVIYFLNDGRDDLYHIFQEHDIPVVLIDYIPQAFQKYPVDCVLSDNINGSLCLIRYLIEKGHKNITIFGDAKVNYSIAQRTKVCIEECEKNQISYSIQSAIDFSLPESLHEKEVSKLAGSQFQQMIKSSVSGTNPPTAIIVLNLISAIGCLSAISQTEYKIPEDFSLVCFDDDPLLRCYHPSITCVEQNLEELGISASELLLQRIVGNFNNFPEIKKIDTIFHERKSVRDLR